VLERAILAAGHAPSAAASAGAFGSAFWWSLGISAAPLAPCVALMRAERSVRRSRRAAPPGGSLPAEPPLAEVAG
jgi:hypothetical protein